MRSVTAGSEEPRLESPPMALTLYEMVNARRKELFIGLARSLDEERRRHAKDPCPALKAWEPAELSLLVPVATFPEDKLAQEFYGRYLAKSVGPGWTILTDGR